MKNNLTLTSVGASLRTKIKHYKRVAKELEEYLKSHPDEWRRFENDFNSEVNSIFMDIMNFEKESLAVGKPERLQKLKNIFIKRIQGMFMIGEYGPWSFNKPHGYAGDFKIIDDIYQNNPQTAGFERLFDNYFQMSSISVAVRNRKNDFKRLIIDFCNKRLGSQVRIMNLASGPCREIEEILCSGELLNKDVIFDCYDHELKAIEFAKKLLNGRFNVNFRIENALRLSAARNINSRIDVKYDLIYSTGLFDYLNYKISTRLVCNLRKLLNDNGVLAIADVRDKYSNPSVHYMEWVGDWNLVYRNENEFRKIFIEAGFSENDLELRYEQQGLMQYIVALN